MIKVSIYNEDTKEKLELEMPADSDIYDWKKYFEIVLIWLTFSQELIKELFNPKLEE